MLYPQQTPTRSLCSLDGVWDLARETGPGEYSTGFRPEKKAAVPGSFNDLYTDEALRSWQAGIWVARRFTVPELLREQRLVLRFGSVTYRAEVYLNGQHLGGHETGYTPFEFDITDAVHFGKENLLCVRVENILSAETVPMGNLGNKGETGQFSGQYPDTPFDFFPYAGIHRPVSVYSTSKKAWLESVKIKTELGGHVTVYGTVGGCASKICFQCLETQIKTSVVDGRFLAEFQIEEVQWWDVNDPHLYDLWVRLHDEEGVVLDEYTQRFGVRTIAVDGGRLLLNGKPLYLKGFGRHEDFPIIGKGLNHSVNIRDHELLKWINANSYRTSHYPYSEELVQLADEQGILLIAEAPAVSIHFDYATSKTLELHRQVLAELIDRDFNSPSVIMWSVANEATSDRPEARPYFQSLSELVRSLDSSRPVTLVSCKDADDEVLDLFDVVSLNLYPGWYELPGRIDAAKEELRRLLTAVHLKFRKPVFIAEFGADAIPGMHSLPAEQWSEEYQTELILALIDVMREYDCVVGEHVWNFADFRTGQQFARVGGNRKGVFTRERQPKMVAHFLRRKWAGYSIC